jgi:hypothetical protein
VRGRNFLTSNIRYFNLFGFIQQLHGLLSFEKRSKSTAVVSTCEYRERVKPAKLRWGVGGIWGVTGAGSLYIGFQEKAKQIRYSARLQQC